MRPEYSLGLFEAAHRRFGADGIVAGKRFLDGLFEQQRAFVENRARFKVALCGRRAGKTEGLVAWLIDGAERKPGSTSVYVSLSQRHARRILWETLKRVVKRHDLKITCNEQTLIATLDNGSRIWVTGCDDRAACENFRGDFYYRVAIDEAASFPVDWFGYLIDDVLMPALVDHRGELALAGTPGLVRAGYFFEVCEGDMRWPVHHWTCLDNPHIPGAEELERLKERNRWDDNHPTLLREWLGQWVRDDEALVYPYDAGKNTYNGIDTEKMYRVLSVDLGWSDGCGFVIGASRRGDPEWYCERAWREHGLTVSHIAGKIDQLRHSMRIDRIVVDEGALGKSIAEDFRISYGIPCVKAEKQKKLATIHMFRAAMKAGTVKINPHECRHLREEWTMLPWNEDMTDHNESFMDDCSDSALYNWREHRLDYRPEEEQPKPGTPEAMLREAAKAKAATFKRIREQAKRRFTMR